MINDAVTEAANNSGTSRRSKGFLSEVPMDLIEKRRGRYYDLSLHRNIHILVNLIICFRSRGKGGANELAALVTWNVNHVSSPSNENSSTRYEHYQIFIPSGPPRPGFIQRQLLLG